MPEPQLDLSSEDQAAIDLSHLRRALIYEQPMLMLSGLAVAIVQGMDNVLAQDVDTSIGRLRVLMMLAHGARRVSEIAEFERISLPTASNKLSRMEREGLVQRVSDPTDGRATLAALTPSGRQLMHRAVRAIESFIYDRLEVLGEGEVSMVVPVLQKMLLSFTRDRMSIKDLSPGLPFHATLFASGPISDGAQGSESSR